MMNFESKQEKQVFLGICALLILVVGVVAYSTFDSFSDTGMDKGIVKTNSIEDNVNPPELTIENVRYDFGTIKQSEGVVSTFFVVKNTGKSDLIINYMDTSCMCTTASLNKDNKEGPMFGMSMHGSNPDDYELKISPGEFANLKVNYDPMAHGIQKEDKQKITRSVTIYSNDPVNSQKKVRIELIQLK